MGGSLSKVLDDICFRDLMSLVFEDYGVDEAFHSVFISYKVNRLALDDLPPLYIRNDRQFKTFLEKTTEVGHLIHLCVTFRRKSNVEVPNLSEQCVRDVSDSVAPRIEQGGTSLTCKKMSNQGIGDSFPLLECGDSAVVVKSHLAEAFNAGNYYRSKEDLMKTIRLHALNENFEFRTRMSDVHRVVLGCVDRKCSWRLTAYSVDKLSRGFRVYHYMSKHICDTTNRNVNHRQATAKILGEMVSNHFEGGKLGLKPKQIIEKVRKDHGVNISYWKAYRAQGYAEDVIRGSPEDNYHLLPKWLHVLKEKNPGSVSYLERDCLGKFKYAFVSFGPSIRGFKLLRKIIAIDGAFLKSKFRGTLLGATAQDGNFQLFPIAFGIVDSENDESWDWFLRCLRTVIPDDSDLMFVSDRAQSIAKGLCNVYPLAHHGICTFHFEKNIAKNFKDTSLMSLVHEASRAYSKTDFDMLFGEIKIANPALADYLECAGISRWARSYSPVNRFNIMTSNIAESLNAMLRQPREYPIVCLLETIRLTLTRWFHDRLWKACDHRHPLTTEVGKIMKGVYDSSCYLEECQVNKNVFEVKGESRTHIVDLFTKQCTCRKFDLDGYPCSHAFAAVKHTNISENTLVTDYYSNKRLIQVYSESIYPLGHEDGWKFPKDVADVVCLPPSTRVPSGRRKKKRFLSLWEYGRSRREYKCGRCGETGHNKGSCCNPI